MAGFELWNSGKGCDHSANCAQNHNLLLGVEVVTQWCWLSDRPKMEISEFESRMPCDLNSFCS